MLPIDGNEEFTFVGEIIRPLFRNRYGNFIKFNVTEVNHRRVRPESLMVCLTDGQARRMARFDIGDTFFVEAECLSDEDANDVKAINLARILDYKLMYSPDNSSEHSFKDHIRDMARGRIFRR